MSPATQVYLCDKVADHGKGKPCRKLVEGGGVQVQIEAIALPLDPAEASQTIRRQFHNAADAQHWLRRISVKDLLATAYPHEQGALINGVPEPGEAGSTEPGPSKRKRSGD